MSGKTKTTNAVKDSTTNDSTGNERKGENIAEVRIDVPHIKQQYSWDCGLACSKMVLRMYEKDLDDFSSVCSKLAFGQSIWTIDLANIMKHYGVKHFMCTITFGVDKGYSTKGFYRERFSDDEIRVNSLFEEGKSSGLNLEQRSVTLQEITSHLSRGDVVITLVDWSYLRCIWCDNKCLPTFSCMGRCLSTMYQGHFVVLCGFNETRQLIYYKNPSCGDELCCCSFSVFEKSRKSYGTDEDILFLYEEVSDITKSVSDS